MKKFQVLTDSTSDVEKSFRDEYELDYLKMVFTINSRDYDADLDWTDIKPEEYYGLMRKGYRSVTGKVKASEVETKVEKAFKEGLDVLYVACSAKLSGSISTAKMYAEDLLKKYPDRKLICYDSMRTNYAEGLMAMDAAKMALDGLSIDECVAKLNDERLKYQTFATVGSLEWFRKAGRIKATAAFFGNLFAVKPIVIGDANGNNYAYKKVKGRKPSLDDIVQTTIERIEDPENKIVFVAHADCPQDAEYVKERLLASGKIKNVHISPLGPIIGATTGPDTISVNFYGKKIDIAGEE